jgi:putative ABC transport system ATP-binding protein
MSDQTDPFVELANVKLTLPSSAGPVNILRGVDLAVRAGETVSVVGPSGSGKTTMLMVMAGLERPSSGLVRVAGLDLGQAGEDSLARFRRRHVGIVFQAFHLVPTMTALENVALPLEFARVPDSLDRAADCLASVGLAGRTSHYPSQLSGGEQQRVALARAFVAEPSLLLADEPTGNLDAETGKLVMDLLFSLQEARGTTMLLVTHDIALARRCRRQARMADGRLAPRGEGGQVRPGRESDRP